jgi:hypothetical protein
MRCLKPPNLSRELLLWNWIEETIPDLWRYVCLCQLRERDAPETKLVSKE